ncbi:unnamed protein product [Amoebophrya sp. A120]|nr:unnamed protein product [Amoebophrya sp. A120]|eukprot:GSA120T00020484001.1
MTKTAQKLFISSAALAAAEKKMQAPKGKIPPPNIETRFLILDLRTQIRFVTQEGTAASSSA